jgi:hypothetical protein
MSTPQAFLLAWGQLTQRLAGLVDAALDVDPPGGLTPGWQQVLGALKVPPLGEDERFAAAQAEKQTKGAPVPEVRACLEAFARAATAEMAPFRARLTPPQVAVLDSSVAAFAQEALGHFRAQACAKKKGMFGHARKLAAEHRYDAHAAGEAYLLKCPSCGAPRLHETFTCAFCNGELS